MPYKAIAESSRTGKLSLPEWLKVLTSRGVDMRSAMKIASKIYKTHGTVELLSQLSPTKVNNLTDDKEVRKSINNAVKTLASGEDAPKDMKKKRGRDSDLLDPLKEDDMEEDAPVDLDFHLIVDIEQLKSVRLVTNRAPVKTAWAYTICVRLGFTHLESLSLAQAYVHISSLKYALMLGNTLGEVEKKEARRELEELSVGNESYREKSRRLESSQEKRFMGLSAQPWVEIMGSKPIVERQDGTCRAIQKGVPVRPSQAYLYITKAFQDHTPNVMGAMKVVAESYDPKDLNQIGSHIYNEFKPDVTEWGQRGTWDLLHVLNHRKGSEHDQSCNSVFVSITDNSLMKTLPGKEKAEEKEKEHREGDMMVENYEVKLEEEYKQYNP
ncbi:hypothetical protein L204_101338 [Cryptococcus depauperatus]|nr:hypothetical protein L204_04007 [Cryptococcus depauperatus CBS 7855]